MTSNDIIRIAREAGINEATAEFYCDELGRMLAAEREACAKVCADWIEHFRGINKDGLSPYAENQAQGAEACAKAILARGQS